MLGKILVNPKGEAPLLVYPNVAVGDDKIAILFDKSLVGIE